MGNVFLTLQAVTGGKVLDHQLCSLPAFETMRANTKPLWEKKYPHVPFDFNDVSSYKEGTPPENVKTSSAGKFIIDNNSHKRMKNTPNI